MAIEGQQVKPQNAADDRWPLPPSPAAVQDSRDWKPALARSPKAVLLVLIITFAASVLLSLSVGAVHLSLSDVLSAAFARRPLSATERLILLQIRLPRILSSALVGASLSVSGLLFQGLFRNPMADPYVIGASGGSVLGACLGIFFFSQASLLGLSLTAVLAFAGSVLTMVLVYALARSRGRTNVVTLLLAGFAISTILTNCTYFFEVLDQTSGSSTRILLSWLRGVISTPSWPSLAFSGAALALGLLAALPLTRRLNTLALGDEYAHQLGLNVERTRIAIILVGSLLTATAVGLGGLISFAGLIIPHISRLLLGPDQVRLLPVTGLAGAIFLVLADTLARTVLAPTEIPVGILMAVVGGPFFLYLLRRPRPESLL